MNLSFNGYVLLTEALETHIKLLTEKLEDQRKHLDDEDVHLRVSQAATKNTASKLKMSKILLELTQAELKKLRGEKFELTRQTAKWKRGLKNST